MKNLKIGKFDARTVMLLTRVFTLIICVAALTVAGLFISRTMNRISSASSGTGPIHIENIDRTLLNSLLTTQAARSSPGSNLPARIVDPFAAKPSPVTAPAPKPADIPEPAPVTPPSEQVGNP